MAKILKVEEMVCLAPWMDLFDRMPLGS